MISARVRSMDEYIVHRERNAHVYKKIYLLEEALGKQNKKRFRVKGFSYPAQAGVNFRVDVVEGNINWRESVMCPKTKLNGRMRATVHYVDFELSPSKDSNIYITEQLTPLYKFLRKKYNNVTGSEYLGQEYEPGYINRKGIRHEDATKLSFKDGEMDYYLSLDCFEHIPDFMSGFAEAYRILKPGGMMLWTVPFASQSHKNIIRATVAADGAIVHHAAEEYHGNPTRPGKGILCYTHFGWEMLDQLKSMGFKDAYAITYWSDSLGYYDGNQILFCAVK